MWRLSGLRLAFVVGFGIALVLLVLLPMAWPQSNYLNPSYWVATFVLVVIAAGAVVAISGRGITEVAAIVAVGVMTAYLIRVAIDIRHDRTNHNLLPFEYLFDFIGLTLAGMFGGMFGSFATRAVAPRRR